jgi:lipopolysaccharide export system protein LptA
VAIIWLGGAIAVAQTVGEDALKRPIAEAGLTEPAGTVEAPRAVAVRPVAEDAPVQIPKPTGATEITAMEATFDNRKHEAVFSRKVMVTDPEFSVTCDRLTAVLKHSGSAANGKPTERSPAAAPQPAGKSQGGLERAIAEGNVVIKQSKTEADGSTSLSVGRAQRADYNAVTGDITLSGSPSVQQGFNQCVATSPETVMTLNRDRNMRVVGPHRTIISDKADLESPPKSKDQ